MRPTDCLSIGPKSFTLLLLLIAAVSLSAGAFNLLSASSRIMLSRHSKHASCAAPLRSNTCFQVFIALEDMKWVESLRRQGIKIDGAFHGFVTARVTPDILANAISLPGVRHIAMAQPLHLCNDSARSFSHVDPLHEAKGIVAPILGKGVILGVVDCGIDFNHINLLDENGNSRVKAVYLPTDSLGNPPVIDNDTLPGSCYETPWEIAALTTDFNGTNHGTHTTGTAAGSYRGNGWYGVAPQADIVACGMPSDALTDANVVNAVKYIFDYANRMGKPCVINLSLGNNGGPNDGTSFMCQAFSAMSGPGRICVVSAGNDGNVPICFHHSLNGIGDTVTTLLRNQWGGLQRQGYVSMWSNKDQVHKTRLVIVNRYTGEVEYSSPLLGLLPEDSVFCLTSDEDTEFSKYYTGEVLFANALEQLSFSDDDPAPSGRFHSIWDFDVTAVSGEHLLGLQYVADKNTDLAGWCNKTAYFYSFGLSGVVGGSTSGSISDLATTDSVISVGAYCSRNSYSDEDGGVSYPSFNVGDIASFSSYGPDERGISRPDICAPGILLFSSANRYVEKTEQPWPAPVVIDGESFPYCPYQGTSMSAPVVTGAIALMLQINPSLSTAMVRDVLCRSAQKDHFVYEGLSEQWGYGKLDAMAAVCDVIQNTLMPGDVNGDGEVNIIDVEEIINIILGDMEQFDATRLVRADVNRDQEILITDVDRVINMILYREDD